MTRYTDEQAWVHRLMRCGWTYMPALEMIRLHPGGEEAAVLNAETQFEVEGVVNSRVGIFSSELTEVLRKAEAEIHEELSKFLTPEALKRVAEAERAFEVKVLGGDSP